MITGIRSPRHNDKGTIDCEVELDGDGNWHPFTANQNDPDAQGRAVYKRIADEEFGPIAEALPVGIQTLRNRKKSKINGSRETAINAGVIYNDQTYDSDDRSRANLTATVSALQAGIPLPQGFTWRSADNQDVPFDAADLIGLAAAMMEHVNTQYQKSWALKTTVSAAASVEALDAIVW
jgi:hypothetical protein